MIYLDIYIYICMRMGRRPTTCSEKTLGLSCRSSVAIFLAVLM